MGGRGGLARMVLAELDGTVAVTAIGGGIALAAGLEGARFPDAWLEGTPFAGYVVPGAILAGLVGGSAAVAMVATIRGPRPGGRASMIAGAVLAGWIIGEIAILTGDGELVSPVEAAYLAAGIAMAGLGLFVRRQPDRP